MRNLRSHLVMLSLFVVLVSLLVSSRGFAQTPPPIPWSVGGSVTLNGSPAADGYNVTAVDNGAVVGYSLTSGGNYSISIACGTPGITCSSGDTISFQMGGLTASQTFALSSSNEGLPNTLNLTFTGTPAQAQQTTQASVTQVTTTPVSVVTAVTSVSTPEYTNYLPVILAVVLITLGAMTTLRRKNKPA